MYDTGCYNSIFNFDERQNKIIKSPAFSRIIIEGGPGMGKTAVACARVSYLVQQNIEPSNIWLISFTRTAIKEIKSRIDSFLPKEDKYLAKSIRISTIDSQVWHLRHGFDYADSQELFGSYEANILKIIEMLQDNHEGMTDFIEPIEHLIVDEAQDIVGNRNQLIFELVSKMKPNCGITVFVDSAQAIYGFADKDKFSPKPIIDRLIEEERLNFKKLFLKNVFRTSSYSLNSIFTDLREIILDKEIKAKEKIAFSWEYIEEYADKNISTLDLNKLSIPDNSTLLLFRKKDDLYQYSYYLAKEGILHNVRAGGLDPNMPTWIGKIFGLFEKKIIDEDTFSNLWSKRINYDSDISKNEAWKTLLQLCGNIRGKVDVSILKQLILRTPPPLELISSSKKNKITLSTIHASKGREADIVYLFKTDTQIFGNEDQQQEEARVLFVAATRARLKLNIVSNNAFKTNESIRIAKIDKNIIRRDAGNLYHIRMAFTDKKISYTWTSNIASSLFKSIYIQSILPTWLSKVRKVIFITQDNRQDYDIYIVIKDSHFHIGKCDSKLNSILVHTIKGLVSHAEDVILPKKITAYCTGTRTIPLSDENIGTISNPYLNTGMCIAPIFSVFFEFPLLKIAKRPPDNNHHVDDFDLDDYETMPSEIMELAIMQDEKDSYGY